jgi:hypothetical protein
MQVIITKRQRQLIAVIIRVRRPGRDFLSAQKSKTSLTDRRTHTNIIRERPKVQFMQEYNLVLLGASLAFQLLHPWQVMAKTLTD